MKKWQFSTITFGFIVSLLLIFAVVIQTPAENRESELEGGLQIWIDVGTEPSNREGEDTFKLGKDDSLAQDFLAGVEPADKLATTWVLSSTVSKKRTKS